MKETGEHVPRKQKRGPPDEVHPGAVYIPITVVLAAPHVADSAALA
jgi:hypothetical protein